MTAPGRAVAHDVGGMAVVRRDAAPAAPDPCTVVFVHGAMDRAASFGRPMRRLAEHHTVAVDRRGYAGSASSAPAATLDDSARDLLAVVEWTGSDRAVIVGHSFGGLVVLRAAELAGPGAAVRAVGSYEAPMPWSAEYGATGEDTLAVAAAEGAAAAAESFYRSMVGDAVWSRLKDSDRALRRAEGPALVADLHVARLASAAPDPTRWPAPVRSARGSASPHRLRWAAEQLALWSGHPVRELDGAGHGAHLTHPDRFADWVRDLVALLPLPWGTHGGSRGAPTDGV